MTAYTTAQENFWAGEFGTEYSARNVGDALQASNVALFARALERTRGVQSVLELGANIGLNLQALKTLLPAAALHAVEINPQACEALRALAFVQVTEGSLLARRTAAKVDLALVKGVLIHIAPEKLPEAYDALEAASQRYVLIAEYYNPTPVSVPYRGHADRLFKRDFAGEFMDRHPGWKLVDYGFAYRRDPVFPLDDVTWFLLERT